MAEMDRKQTLAANGCFSPEAARRKAGDGQPRRTFLHASECQYGLALLR